MVSKALEILYLDKVASRNGEDVLEEKVRCVVKKWQFQDSVMGEQYISFTISSETPIEFAVGDYCIYRGETFTLNYIPSVTQKAKRNQTGDAFTYDMVKFDSCREELERACMLDITPTTGDYKAALGTNYTGSDQFQLFCGETTANGMTLTPVCALAAKMQANLDRAFPTAGWKVLVDTTSTHTVNGVEVLNTHTDDKVLSFDNTTIAAALSEVHNTFDLDYTVKGRTIYIGYTFDTLTEEGDSFFYFGYGKGYADMEHQGRGLFQIKKQANSNQKIVTRLRAIGSKKNLPYRYYNNKYGLSQALFPLNLQLPDTFETPSVKAANNVIRKSQYPYVRDVKGDTNDAYIEKNDDCYSTIEGLREDGAKWDGSNSNLEEIYPTIKEATYGELRAALCKDQDGVSEPTRSFPNYLAGERIDAILQVENDANIGNGIMPESNTSSETKAVRNVDFKNQSLQKRDIGYDGDYKGKETTLFTVESQTAGTYILAPSQYHVWYGVKYSLGRHDANMTKSCLAGYRIIIYVTPKSTKRKTKLATYQLRTLKTISNKDSKATEFELPALPDVTETNPQVKEIKLTETSDVEVAFVPIFKNLDSSLDQFSFSYYIGYSKESDGNSTDFKPEYVWDKADSASTFMNTPFHVIVKDMGFDFVAAYNTGEEPTVSMTSGRCVAREFVIADNPEKVTVTKNNKTYKGWRLTLSRAEDSNLHTYYPSQTSPLAADDNFVLLNIEMPEVYIKMAEVRLLIAATNYLRDNCETQFSYIPSLNDIFLQQNFDAMNESGHPEKSIYWKLYAGLKFPFYGIPETAVADEDEILPLVNVTIETITIKEGEGLTPKVDIKLNSDVQQSTIQRITTAIDRIYNGSIFNNGSGGDGTGGVNLAELRTMIYQICNERFLSRLNDDNAAGKIGLKRGATFGKFNHGYIGGTGAQVDEDGNAEFESVMSRGFIETPEYRFNRIDVVCGEQWNAPSFGLIESVDTEKQIIYLKLEDGELSGMKINDICRGLFHFEEGGNSESNYIDQCGFVELAGFSTSYFTPIEVYENGASFKYALRPGTHVHPRAGMKFAVYGNFTDKDRQSSHYSTRDYDRYLCNVDTWVIDPDKHIYKQDGLLEGLVINGFEMHGYGSYSHNNYFSGVNIQFDRTIIEDLTPDIYSVHLSSYECAVLVDIEGNIVESSAELMNIVTGTKNVTANGDGEDSDNVVTSRWRWFTTVQAHNADTPLLFADAVQEGRFVVVLNCVGCTAVCENGVVYVTSIDTKADENYVNVHVNCEGNATYDQRFNITLIPQPEDNVTVDLDNEMKTFASDDKGNVKNFEAFETHARMWYGNDKRMYITKAELVYLPDGIQTNATIQEDGNKVTSLVIPVDSTHAFATLQIKSFKKEAAETNNIIIRVTGKIDEKANRLFTKDTSFALNKAMMGENAIDFDLIPSVNQVQVDAEKGITNGRVSCMVQGKDGKEVFDLTTNPMLAAQSLSMKVRLFNSDSESSSEIDYDPETTFVCDTSVIGGKKFTKDSLRVVFYLYYKNPNGVTILIDKEGVPVVKDGVGYVGTEEYYALWDDNETPPTGWNNKDSKGVYAPKSPWTKDKPTHSVDSSKPYLWNFEVSTFTEGTQQITSPICIGNFARGIVEVIELYAVSNNKNKKVSDGSPAGTDIKSWVSDIESISPTDEQPYLWNKTITVYNDSENTKGEKASTLDSIEGQTWKESTCDVTYHICAVKGQPGNSYGGFTEYYKLSDSGTVAPTFDENNLANNVSKNGWSLGTIPTYTGGKNKYLWNAEVSESTEYGDNDYTGTTKRKVYIGCIGDFSKSISGITEEYAASSSKLESEAKKITKWYKSVDDAMPNETDRYVWNRTTVKYSDGSADDVTYHICLIKSVDVKGIEEYFKRTNSKTNYGGGYTADKRPDSTWTKGTAPDYANDDKIWLWNMEVTVLDDGTLSTTPPHCIGNFANGIKSIENWYMLSTDGINHPAEKDKAWQKDVMPDIVRDTYLWNKEVVTMLDDDVSTSYHVIALYASDGKDAPLAVLSDTIVSVPTDANGKVVGAFSEDIQIDLMLNGVDDIQPKTVAITTSNKTSYTTIKNNGQQNKVYLNVAVANGVTLTEDTIKVDITGYDSTQSTDDKGNKYYAERKGVAYFHIRRWKSGDGFLMEYYGPVKASATAPTIATYNNFTWKSSMDSQVTQELQCMYAALWSTTSDGNKKELKQVFLFARYGDHGADYVGTTEYYALGASNSSAPGTYPPQGTYKKGVALSMSTDWSKDKPKVSPYADKPWLWNFEVSLDSDGNQYVTSPICIGNFARGIVEVIELYAISNQSVLNNTVKNLTWLTEIANAAPTYTYPYQWNKTITAYNDSEKDSNGSWKESTCDVHYHISAVRGSSAITFAILCADTIKPGDDYIPVDILRTDSGNGSSLKRNLEEAYNLWGVKLTCSGLTYATVEDDNDSQLNLVRCTITKNSTLRLTLKLGTNIVTEKELRGVTDGKDNIEVYYSSLEKPTKPSGTLAQALSQGWSETPIDKNNVTVSYSGSFLSASEGFRKAPTTAAYGTSTEILTIKTTKANQAVGILMRSSSEEKYDVGYVGKLNATDALNNFVGSVSGNNNEILAQVDIPTAGTHTIRISYHKDGSNDDYDDTIYYKLRKIKIWKSKATVDSAGNITSWSDPYTSDSDDGSNGNDGKDSTSYWLDSIVGCINFTHAGYPSPNSFNVSAKQKKGEGAVSAASFYFKAFAYDGSNWTPVNIYWNGGGGSSFTNKKVSSVTVGVSATTNYKQYLIKAFDTQPTASTAATADCVCEKAIGVAIDGESITGAKGDSVFPNDRGFWSEDTHYFYKKVGDMVVRDKVVSAVGDKYYNFAVRTRDDNTTTGITAKPTLSYGESYSGDGGDANWELLSVYRTLVVDTLFGNNANLGGFIASSNRFLSSQVAYFVRYLSSWSSSTAYEYVEPDTLNNLAAPRIDMVSYDSQYWVPKQACQWTYRYRGTYNPSTTYESVAATASNGLSVSRYDIVYYNSQYWILKNIGTSNNNAPSSSSTYWRLANDAEKAAITAPSASSSFWRLATIEEVNCAQYGTGSVTPLYKLELNGIDGIIKLLHAKGYKWEVTLEGIQILGVETGRHIEIDPNAREFRIYNDSGELSVTFSGETMNNLADLFSGKQAPNISFTQASYANQTTGDGYTGSSGVVDKTKNTLIGSFTTEAPGKITIKGTLGARCNRKAYTASELSNYSGYLHSAPYTEGGLYWVNNTAYIQYMIKTYQNGHLVDTQYTKSVFGSGLTSLWVSESVSRDIALEAGTHYIYVHAVYYVQSGASYFGYVRWSNTSASFVYDFYQSRIFANGLAFGLSENNFFGVVRNSGGNMEYRYSTNNLGKGFDCTPANGFRFADAKNWFKPLMPVMFLYCTTSNGYWSNNGSQSSDKRDGGRISVQGRYTFDDSYFGVGVTSNASANYGTIKMIDTGVYRITFPTNWSALNLSLANTMVKMIGIFEGSGNYDSTPSCKLSSFTSTQLTFVIADDASRENRNYGFQILLEKLQS